MGRELVAVGSAKGSPGVTTLVLALAACWPVSVRRPRPLVVEADPSGGDVTARFELSDSPGLVDLAAAARRTASPRVLGECVQVLPGGVPVVVGPAGAQQAVAAVRLFTGNGPALLRAGMGSDGSVLLDVGRFQAESAALVEAADRLLLVSRGGVDALAHAAARAADFLGCGRSVELVLVGPSPYPLSEISEVLGVRQVHRVPWDPRTAHALAGRSTMSPHRWRSAQLVHAATALARHLTDPVAEKSAGADPDVSPLPASGPARERACEGGVCR